MITAPHISGSVFPYELFQECNIDRNPFRKEGPFIIFYRCLGCYTPRLSEEDWKKYKIREEQSWFCVNCEKLWDDYKKSIPEKSQYPIKYTLILRKIYSL